MQDSRCSISSKFPSAYRLLRGDGFDQVIRAEHVTDKHFKIFFNRNGKNNARLGIIASKKLQSSAVDRNRVKRFIRETFRKHSIKLCKLDLVVKVNYGHSWEVHSDIDNLIKLFSQVENRCAE